MHGVYYTYLYNGSSHSHDIHALSTYFLYLFPYKCHDSFIRVTLHNSKSIKSALYIYILYKYTYTLIHTQTQTNISTHTHTRSLSLFLSLTRTCVQSIYIYICMHLSQTPSLLSLSTAHRNTEKNHACTHTHTHTHTHTIYIYSYIHTLTEYISPQHPPPPFLNSPTATQKTSSQRHYLAKSESRASWKCADRHLKMGPRAK